MNAKAHGVLGDAQGWFTTVMAVQLLITNQSDVCISNFTTHEARALLQKLSGAGAFISKSFSFPERTAAGN
jgi:hypothetical protein